MARKKVYTASMLKTIVDGLLMYEDLTDVGSRKELIQETIEVLNSDKDFPRRLDGGDWGEHHAKTFLRAAGLLSKVPDGRSGEIPTNGHSNGHSGANSAAKRAARRWLADRFGLPTGGTETVGERAMANAALEILSDFSSGRVSIPKGETIFSLASKVQNAAEECSKILGRN